MRALRILGASGWVCSLIACGDGDGASSRHEPNVGGHGFAGAAGRTGTTVQATSGGSVGSGGSSINGFAAASGETHDGGSVNSAGSISVGGIGGSGGTAENGGNSGEGATGGSGTSSGSGGFPVEAGAGGYGGSNGGEVGIGGTNPDAGGNPSGAAGALSNAGTGAAGTGNTAGSAGSTGEAGGPVAEIPRICLPHSPCSVADYVVGSGCVETPLPDGAACNDGHVCTKADHCEAGRCVGTAYKSEAREEAVVHGFGGYSEVDGEATQHGLAVPLSEKQLVFADQMLTGSTLLTLVNVTDSGTLEPVDRLVSPVGIERGAISPWVFAGQTRAALIPLTSTRFIFSGRGVQLFDAANDHLQPIEMSSVPGAFQYGFAANANRYWTCAEDGIHAYSIQGTPPGLQQIGNYWAPDCHALAATGDGSMLFAATNRGLFQLKNTESGALELVGRYFPSTAYFNLAAQGDILIAQEMWAPLGFGPLKSYRWTNAMELLGTYPENWKSAPSLLGFSVQAAGVFAEQFLEEPTINHLTLRSLGLSDLAPLGTDYRFYSRWLDTSEYYKIIRPSAGFNLVVTQPVRRVLRVGSDGSSKTPIHGELQGFFEAIYPVDATHAVALDAHGRHEIDLTTPGSPIIRSTQGVSTQPARLALGLQSEIGTWTDNLSDPPTEFSLLTMDRERGLTLEGRVKLGGSRQALSGDDLVQCSFESGKNRFQLQVFPLESLRRGQDVQSLTFGSELWVQGSEKPSDAITTVEFSADAESLVIAENLLGVSSANLHWLDKTETGFLLASEKRLAIEGAGIARQVLVSGKLALVVTDLEQLILVANDGVQLTVVAQSPQLGGQPRVLRWSGDFVYVAVGWNVANVAPSLEVLSPATLARVAGFPLEDGAASVAEVGARVVVAVRNGLQIFTPTCSL